MRHDGDDERRASVLTCVGSQLEIAALGGHSNRRQATGTQLALASLPQGVRDEELPRSEAWCQDSGGDSRSRSPRDQTADSGAADDFWRPHFGDDRESPSRDRADDALSELPSRDAGCAHGPGGAAAGSGVGARLFAVRPAARGHGPTAATSLAGWISDQIAGALRRGFDFLANCPLLPGTPRRAFSMDEPPGPFAPAALLECLAKLRLHDRPFLGTPPRLEDHADQTLDAEPGVPEPSAPPELNGREPARRSSTSHCGRRLAQAARLSNGGLPAVPDLAYHRLTRPRGIERRLQEVPR
jgi:hypothetical protein